MNQILKPNIAFLYFKNDKVIFYVSKENLKWGKLKKSNLQINSPAAFVPEASYIYLIHFWPLLSFSHGDTLRN